MCKEEKLCKQCGARVAYYGDFCADCREENDRQEILQMSEAELAAKIDYVCANIQQLENQDNDEIRYLCEMLIDYRNINTSRLAELAWEHGLTYYQTIYKDAPPQVVEEMLNRLRQDDLKPWDGCKLLLCLAEAGGPAVHQAFWELQQQPRSWSRQLSTTPAVFATYGGWSFDSQGRWTPTNFAECYPLVKGTAAEKAESPVKIALPAGEGEICEHCGTPLVNLLEIDGRDPRLAFLGLDGVVRAKCCPDCLIYAIDDPFCRYQLDGGSQPLPFKSYNDGSNISAEEFAEMVSNTYILGPGPVSPRYAADWYRGSSIGGVAFWWQGPEIKTCPECGKPMMYLAQIQLEDIWEKIEGNAYIEICRDCQILVVLHQND